MGKTIKEKLKEAEKYICENFDELEIDDPVEEGYFEEYEHILNYYNVTLTAEKSTLHYSALKR